MLAMHEIVIDRSIPPERLTAKKFWSIECREEFGVSLNTMAGREITFRGGLWRFDWVGEQSSILGHLAGVKQHPEKTAVEMIAAKWGAMRVRVWDSNGIAKPPMTMCGPLTRQEAVEAQYALINEPDNGDPFLMVYHPIKGNFRLPFSITMPGESHQAVYSRDAGCVAIKMSRLPSA